MTFNSWALLHCAEVTSSSSLTMKVKDQSQHEILFLCLSEILLLDTVMSSQFWIKISISYSKNYCQQWSRNEENLHWEIKEILHEVHPLIYSVLIPTPHSRSFTLYWCHGDNIAVNYWTPATTDQGNASQVKYTRWNGTCMLLHFFAAKDLNWDGGKKVGTAALIQSSKFSCR